MTEFPYQNSHILVLALSKPDSIAFFMSVVVIISFCFFSLSSFFSYNVLGTLKYYKSILSPLECLYSTWTAIYLNMYFVSYYIQASSKQNSVLCSYISSNSSINMTHFLMYVLWLKKFFAKSNAIFCLVRIPIFYISMNTLLLENKTKV